MRIQIRVALILAFTVALLAASSLHPQRVGLRGAACRSGTLKLHNQVGKDSPIEHTRNRSVGRGR
jgi:hypothetical protein